MLDTLPAPAADYLSRASERFQTVFTELDALVREIFPGAVPIFQWDMPGWKVDLVPLDDPTYKGTMDPNFFALMLVERKNGITLHVWNSRDYYGLSRAEADLKAAGFKVMRGCLVFNRKQPYPVDAIGNLLRGIRENLGDALR